MSKEVHHTIGSCSLSGSLEHFHYDANASVVVCNQHRSGFTNMAAIRSHLREKHGCEKVVNATIRASIMERFCNKPSGNDESSSIDLKKLDQTPKCLGGRENLSILAAKYHSTDGNHLERGEKLDCIKGLEIYKGKQCNTCSFCAVSSDAMISHMHLRHGLSVEDSERYVQYAPSVHLQTIGQARALWYFPVQPHSDIHRGSNTGKSLSSERCAEKGSSASKLAINVRKQPKKVFDWVWVEMQSLHPSTILGNPKDREYAKPTKNRQKNSLDPISEDSYREKGIFLTICGFEEILSAMGIPSLDAVPCQLLESYKFTKVKGTNSAFGEESTVVTHIEDYLMKGSHATFSSAPFVKKIVRPSDGENNTYRSPFTPVTTKGTVKNYAQSISRLVLFCIRMSKVCDAPSADATKNHQASIASDGKSMANLVTHFPPHIISLTREYSLSRRALSAQNGDVMSKRRLSGEHPNMSRKKWEQSDMSLHQLLRAILLETHDNSTSAEKIFIRMFISLFSVHCDKTSRRRRFRNAHEMSPMLAAIQYVTSITAIVELRSHDLFFPAEGGESSSKHNSNREYFLRSYEPYEIERVKKSFCLKSNTALCYVRDVLDNCMRVMKNDTSRIRYLACASHPKCALVDGNELSLHKLSSVVESLQNEAERVVRNELMYGMPLPASFQEKINHLQDDFMSCKEGFNFLSIPRYREWALETSSSLISYICSSDKLYDEWFLSNNMCKSTNNEVENGAFREAVDERGSSVPDTGMVSNERDITNTSLREHVSLHEKLYVLNIEYAKRWLQRVQCFLESMLVIAHIMGGGTARATEIGTYQCQNGPYSARNVYITQGEVVLVCRYNKTQAMTGKQRVIARVLDQKSSWLFLMYFILVKPLEVWLVEKLHGKKRAEEHSKILFVDGGARFSDERIRSVVQASFAANGIPFNFIQYRHYQAAMAERFLSSRFVRSLYESDDSNDYPSTDQCHDVCSILHDQAGHSAGTVSKTYGTGAHTMKGISTHQLAMFREASIAWQRLLARSLQEDNRNKARERSPREEDSERPLEKQARELATKTMLLPLTNQPASGFTEQNLRKIISEEIRASLAKALPRKAGGGGSMQVEPANSTEPELSTEKNGSDYAHPGGLSGTKRKFPYENPGEGLIVNELSRAGKEHGNASANIFIGKRCSVLRRKNVVLDWKRILPYLRSMRQNAESQFKSVTQLEGIAEALDMKEDFIAVMPTGSGKSDIFLLPSFIATGKRTTIVIVPLVSLMMDLKIRCEEYGISAGTWESRETADLQLLIISVEHTALREYGILVGEMANAGRISRIVVDEAHLTILWSSFREPLGSLSTNLCPTPVPIQKILPSATVPPSQEETLARAHGLSNFAVLRAPTVRSNLSYRVVLSIRENFVSESNSLMKNSVEVIHQEFERFKGVNVKGNLGSNTTNDILRNQMLVYCPTRSMVQELVTLLREEEWLEENCLLQYHAGMTETERNSIQMHWNNYKNGLLLDGVTSCQIVVATSAFGTGIDSPIVRSVIHVAYARSIMEYVQESGRAGRDGKVARCTVVYSRRFSDGNLDYIRKNVPDLLHGTLNEVGKRVSGSNNDNEKQFRSFQTYAEQTTCCRRQVLFGHMDVERPEPCMFRCSGEDMWCDVCANVDLKQSMFFPLVEKACDASRIPNSHIKESTNPTSLSSPMFPKKGSVEDENETAPTHAQQSNALQISNPGSSQGAEGISGSYGMNTTTTLLNCDEAASCRQVTRNIVERCRLKCSRLLNNCMLCFAEKGNIHENQRKSSCLQFKCLRCFEEGHDYDKCPIFSVSGAVGRITAKESACYACGLRMFNGKSLHERFEYGSTKRCPWFSGIQFVLTKLCNPSSQASLKRHLESTAGRSACDLLEEYLMKAPIRTSLYCWLVSMEPSGKQLNLMIAIDFFLPYKLS